MNPPLSLSEHLKHLLLTIILLSTWGCAGSHRVDSGDEFLQEDVLASKEWQAFLYLASTRGVERPELEKATIACRTAIFATKGGGSPSSRSDTCLDAAAKSLHPNNAYQSIAEWRAQNVSKEELKQPEIREVRAGVLLIPIRVFTGDSYDSIVSQMRRLSGTRQIRVVVFDLRGNEGGVLEDVLATASIFMNKDRLGYTKRREIEPLLSSAPARQARVLPTVIRSELRNARLIVLVDRLTSSGAELFAEGLRRNRSALLIGIRTAGVADVYSFTRLIRKDRAIKLHDGKLQDTDGNTWEGTGLAVDLELPLPETEPAGTDSWLKVAIERGVQGVSK